jgi:hypothetical protein
MFIGIEADEATDRSDIEWLEIIEAARIWVRGTLFPFPNQRQ